MVKVSHLIKLQYKIRELSKRENQSSIEQAGHLKISSIEKEFFPQLFLKKSQDIEATKFSYLSQKPRDNNKNQTSPSGRFSPNRRLSHDEQEDWNLADD